MNYELFLINTDKEFLLLLLRNSFLEKLHPYENSSVSPLLSHNDNIRLVW
jgi:hypothetical protein